MTKVPDNIAEFQRMVGFVLGRLYEIHPAELLFASNVFFGDLPHSHEERFLFQDTVNYLVRNGYLHQDGEFLLQLTPASWQVLKQPNPLDSSQTLGSALASWAGDAVSEAGKGVMTQVAGNVLDLVYAMVRDTV